MTSCKLFHSPVTSFDLSREGEFEISLAQGNFLEYLEEKGRKSGKGRVQVGEKRVQRGKRKGNGKGNGMEGKGEAYRFIDGERGGKGTDGMGRGTGNTGDGEGEVREERKEKKKESEDEVERKRIKEKGTGKRELEKVNVKGSIKGIVKVK